MRTFNNFEEIKPYYNEKTNTYEFIENGIRLDVEFKFHLSVGSHINARGINAWHINAWHINAWHINALNINAWDINALNINAWDINAENINAWDINAEDIKARNINYFAVCLAYKNITCTSIKGRRENAKHFALDGEIIIKPKEEKKPVTLELTDEQLEKIKKMLGEKK